MSLESVSSIELSVLGVALASVITSWLSVQRLIGYLKRSDIVDRPNDRTLHQGAIPRGGGLVIVTHVLVALIIAGLASERYAMFGSVFILTSMWAALSWWDDRYDLSPRLRFTAQIAFAVLTVMAFGWVSVAYIGFGIWLNFAWFGALCTVFGVLWMANLYNFMDGMDGLAASQTIIGAITLGFWFWQLGDIWFAFVCAVLAASCYGFLLWNWHPAKIFMGDVGSITIGALFATLLIIMVTRYDIPAVSLVLLFGLFIVDSSATLIRRMVRREPFWLPHRSHYYQRLAAVGIPHNRIVLGATLIMLLCSLNATLCVLYRDMIGLAIVAELALLFSAAAAVVWLEFRRSV